MSDALVIGSSPQLLIDAIGLARAGWRVEVHEGRDRLGGAWAVTDFAGRTNVELACHLIEREEAAYDLLRALGVPLTPMDPVPDVRPHPGVRFPYTSTLAAGAQLAWYPVAHARSLAVERRSSDRADWRRRRRLHLKELKDSVRDRSPVLGVAGGAGVLVSTLAAHARELGVTITTGSRVERLEIGARGSTTVHHSGHTSEPELVVLPAAFHPERIRIEGRELPTAMRTRSYVHWLLGFDEGAVTPHSYTRYAGDPVLQRSSNITDSATATGSGAADEILLVSVRCDERGEPTASLDTVLTRLSRHGVVSAGTRPWVAERHRYQGRDASDTLLGALDGHPRVRVLPSFGDLARALVRSPPVPAMRPSKALS